MSLVTVERYEDGTEVAYVSPLVANYNAANLDHCDAVTEPGWYANGEGPYESEAEVIEAYGLEEQESEVIA